jgi:hypothetical protein
MQTLATTVAEPKVVRAGETGISRLVQLDRADNPISMVGRNFVQAWAFADQITPFLIIPGVLSPDGFYTDFPREAALSTIIYTNGLSRALRVDIVETTGGGSQPVLTGAVKVEPGSGLPGEAPVSWDRLPIEVLLVSPEKVVARLEGAPGLAGERGNAWEDLVTAGVIASPDAEAFDVYVDGKVAPFAAQAGTFAGQAGASATAAGISAGQAALFAQAMAGGSIPFFLTVEAGETGVPDNAVFQAPALTGDAIELRRRTGVTSVLVMALPSEALVRGEIVDRKSLVRFRAVGEGSHDAPWIFRHRAGYVIEDIDPVTGRRRSAAADIVDAAIVDLRAERAALTEATIGGVKSIEKNIPGVLQRARNLAGFILGDILTTGERTGIFSAGSATAGARISYAWSENPATRAAYFANPTLFDIIVVKGGQSNEDSNNVDPADTDWLGMDAPYVDENGVNYGDWVLMPSTIVNGQEFGPRVNGSPITMLVPCRETNNYPGRKATSATSCGTHLHKLIFDRIGVRARIIMIVSALGGQPVDNLGLGSAPFENARRAIDDVCNLSRLAGRVPIVVGDTFTQGEADKYAQIAAQMRQYEDLGEASIGRALMLSGQELRPGFYLNAVSTGTLNDAFQFAPGLTAERIDGRFGMRAVQPLYSLPHVTAEANGATGTAIVHLSMRGHCIKGMVEAHVIFEDWFGPGWNAFRPSDDAWEWNAARTVLRHGYDVPLNAGLAFNTALVSNTVATRYGFQFWNNGLLLPRTNPGGGGNWLTGVAIVPGASADYPARELEFSFATAVQPGSLRKNYACRADGPMVNGPTSGGRGNVATDLVMENVYIPGVGFPHFALPSNRIIPC